MNQANNKQCSPLAVFNFLFAFSYLLDFGSTVSRYLYLISFSSFDLFNIFKLLTVFVAVLTVIKPSSLKRSITLYVLLLIYTSIKLPRLPNHSVFAAIVMLSILTSFIFSRIKYRNEFTQTKYYEVFAPAVRMQIIVLYFWAAFHKLNKGFFDKLISCATIQIFNIKNTLTFLPTPEWLIISNSYLTLIIETAIPVLLVINKTRIYGLILGLLFHFILGFRYPGFTILVFAFLSLFIPNSSYEFIKSEITEIYDKFINFISKWSNYYDWKKSKLDSYLFHIVWAVFILYVIQIFMRGDTLNYFIISRAGLYLIVCLLIFMLFFKFVIINKNYKTVSNNLSIIPVNPVLIIFPALVFINGLAPHIGLKNIQSMAMFSNLRTGGGTTNHYIIPASFQIFSNLEELVKIKGSNIRLINQFSGFTSTRPIPGTNVKLPQPYLDYLEENDLNYEKRYEYKIPIELLRDIVTSLKKVGVKDIKIEYEKDGNVFYTRNAEHDSKLTGSSPLKIKLLSMRAIPNDERGLCMW